jgi:hypothetical protein
MLIEVKEAKRSYPINYCDPKLANPNYDRLGVSFRVEPEPCVDCNKNTDKKSG